MRRDLVSQVRQVLALAGFYLSQETPIRPVSFDVIARRDHELLIVKVLSNIDSLSEALGAEMRLLAEFLGGKALLVGERSSQSVVEAGVVYVRHGVPLVAVETLRDQLLEGVPPLVYAAPGGYYVNLDGRALREIRTRRGLSLGQLAEAAGVSRRAISLYEEGMGALVEVAERLEAFLDEAIIEPVDLFGAKGKEKRPAPGVEGVEGPTREVFDAILRLGYEVVPTTKSPFEGLSRDADVLILTGVGKPEQDLDEKAATVQAFSVVTEKPGFMVLRSRKSRIEIRGVAVVDQAELARMDGPEQLVETIKERGKRVKVE